MKTQRILSSLSVAVMTFGVLSFLAVESGGPTRRGSMRSAIRCMSTRPTTPTPIGSRMAINSMS